MTFSFLSTLCPKTAPTAKSLASHIISKGKFQSGGCTIGAVIKAFLRTSKASLQYSSNTKRESFWRRLLRCLEVLEKSLSHSNFYSLVNLDNQKLGPTKTLHEMLDCCFNA